MKRILLIIFISINIIQAQVITTIAGDSIAGYSGDGGQATNAELYSPSGIAFDSFGNLFIADEYNNAIRKITTSGIISTVVGNGVSGYSGNGGVAFNSQLAFPSSIAFDFKGNMYITDAGNYVIRKVNTLGIITTIAGNGNPYTSVNDGVQATSGGIVPTGALAFDTLGSVFFGDGNGGRVRKIDTSGIITTVVGNGTIGYTGDGGQAILASLSGANCIVFDAIGNMYIADELNNVIRKVSNSGIITTIVGNSQPGYSGDGGIATIAELRSPAAIVFDASGNMYIADSFNNAVRMVNTSGIISTIAGTSNGGYSGDGGPAILAELGYPISLTIDSANNLFIADNGNDRVRKVNLISQTTSINNYKSNTSLNLYPNPNNGNVSINYSFLNDAQLQILDSTGKLIDTIKLNAKEKNIKLNLEILSNGVYLYNISSKNELVKSGRFVVVK